jgi:hypothetical protein
VSVLAPLSGGWLGLTQRLRAPLVVAGAVAAATALVAMRDPHLHGSWGFCPFLALTGRPCPLCGGLRAMNDLTRGDLRSALATNLLVVLAVPAVASAWVIWVRRRVAGHGREEPPLPSAPLTWAGLVLVIAFGVLRNTPWGSVLGP